jgi:uncharacterized protein (DUF58 family)
VSRHLTYRFWVCLVVAAIALVGGLALGQVELLAVGLPFLVLLVASVVDGWWPMVRVLRAEPSTERAIEGDAFALEIEVFAPRSVAWVEFEVQVPATIEPLESLRRVTAIRGHHEFEIPLRLLQWGVSRPDWLTVVSRDRFGLTESVQHVLIATPIRVHPHTERLVRLAPLTDPRQITGDHRSTRRGSGTELAEIRPFRRGDPLRSVHPRLSARRGEPMVAERHVEEAADVIIYVDGLQDIGDGNESTLSWTVTACMALSIRHLRSMDRVGLLGRSTGVRWLEPSLGREARHLIIDTLLATTTLPVVGLIQSTDPLPIPRNATIMAVSPLLSATAVDDLIQLRQRGHDVIVIRPDALPTGEVSDTAQRIFRIENEITRRRLADSGVLVVPWDPMTALEPVVRRFATKGARAATRRARR